MMRKTLLISRESENNLYFNVRGERFFSEKNLELPLIATISDETVAVKTMEEVRANQPLVECSWTVHKIEREQAKTLFSSPSENPLNNLIE